MALKYDKIKYVTNEDAMRIQPIIFKKNNHNNMQKMQTNFEKNNNVLKQNSHQYTGIASVDLAYASMIDRNIAQELKLMGLI